MATLTGPTLKRLITEARIFLGQRNESNSFWKDDELTLYANDAIRQYFLVIQENAEGQFDTTSTINLVANQDTYALPTDHFETKALYRVENGVNYLLPYSNNLTNDYGTIGSGSSIYRPYYYYRGESLVLRPLPNFSETGALLLEYTAFPTTLITGGDTLTNHISPVFKELVVMYMIYKAKLRESSVQGGSTYLPAEKHLSDLYQSFKVAVAGRSKYPQTIIPFNPE